MAKLYELTGAYAAILETEELEEFEAALGALEGAIETKIDGVARVIRTLEAEEEMYLAESHRLAEKAATARLHAAGLKAYLKSNLEVTGQDRIKGAGLLFGARLQVNSSPSVQVADPAALAEEYQRIIPAQLVANTAAIVEHWKATGDAPAGAVVERGRHVRIF